tara:strand:+ start:316 stop:570 length:255 start_codon:yes stop_codon:yes gene_type:complete
MTFIIIPLKELLNLMFFIFLFINLNKKWCKCSLSGYVEKLFLTNFLLIIENKFSKAGYHKSKHMKYGEIRYLNSSKKNIKNKPM